jgi:hypothetical protein
MLETDPKEPTMNHVVNISMVIIGIIAIGVFPPLGMALLIGAAVSHRSNRGRIRRYEAVIAAKHAQKVRRARILAFKAL